MFNNVICCVGYIYFHWLMSASIASNAWRHYSLKGDAMLMGRGVKNIVYEAKKSVLFEKVLITINCYNPIRKERKKEILIKKNYSNVKALIVN